MRSTNNIEKQPQIVQNYEETISTGRNVMHKYDYPPQPYLQHQT